MTLSSSSALYVCRRGALEERAMTAVDSTAGPPEKSGHSLYLRKKGDPRLLAFFLSPLPDSPANFPVRTSVLIRRFWAPRMDFLVEKEGEGPVY